MANLRTAPPRPRKAEAQEVGQRLKTFIRENNLTPAEVASAIGLRPSSLANAFGRNFLSPEAMIKLGLRYNLNLDWLLTSRGTPKLECGEGPSVPHESEELLVRIPLLDSLEASRNVSACDEACSWFSAPSRIVTHPNTTFAAKAHDDSMFPLIQKGWVVVFDLGEEARQYNLNPGGIFVVECEGNTMGLRWVSQVHQRWQVWSESEGKTRQDGPSRFQETPNILGRILLYVGDVSGTSVVTR